MKRFFSEFRVSIFAISLLLSFNLTSTAQEIVQVGAGEYVTAYRTNTGRLFSNKWTGSNSATSYDVGLANVTDVSGAQYSVIALNSAGEVFIVGITTLGVPYANLVPKDNLGNDFKGNTKVYGLYQCYLTIRDGKVWYWGNGDVLNQRGGAVIAAPVQLNAPAGKIMKKLVVTSPTTFGALSTLWGLATDGTVWQWDRTHTTPFQVSFPGGIAQDIAMVDDKAFIVKTTTDLFAWGYYPTYAGARSQWEVSGDQSIKAKWEAAGCVFPIKEMAGNANSLHIIDANDNMFASGSMSQGEIGNGQELSPWRTAPNPWNWDYSNGNNMIAPTQIPGKFKNLMSGNTIAYYKYVQDMGGNWYSWGRNKSFSLGNGTTLAAYGGQGYDQFPNALNVPAPTLVKPLNQTWTVLPFNPSSPRPPFANAGVNQYINSTTTTLYGSGSFQQEGTLTKYEWMKVSGPNAIIASPTSKNTAVSGLINGTYEFKLTVTNNKGVTGTSLVTVKVGGAISDPTPPANQPPSASAGSNQTITLPINLVTLTGSGTDNDGTIVSYSWVKKSGPNAVITTPTLAITTITALTAGTYLFELTVKDNVGATATSTITIIVNSAINQAPTANAGQAQTITLPNNTVTVNGSGSDIDGTIVSYNWVSISGPNTTISSPGTASTTIKGMVAGTYIFQLTVKDNAGATATSTVKIIVQPAGNSAPTANAGNDKSITSPANSVNLSGTGIDSDGTISQYLWTKIAGPTQATIASANSASTNVTSLVQGTYRFELRVTDNAGATGRDTVIIIVNSATNKAPEVNAGIDQSINEPTSTVTLSGTAIDYDGTISAWKWTKTSGPAATINSSTTAQTSISGLTSGVYIFTLSATDDRGLTASDDVQVTVIRSNRNQPPVANAGNDITITLPQNYVKPVGTATDSDGSIVSYKWTKISGPSSYFFYIQNSTSTTPTFRNLRSGVYEFQFTVTDNSGAAASDIMKVVVNSQGTASKIAAKSVAPDQNAQPLSSVNKLDAALNIYPNPAQQIFTTEITGFDNGEEINVTISDISGRILLRNKLKSNGETNKLKMDISNFKTGTYFINARSAKKSISSKIVKAN